MLNIKNIRTDLALESREAAYKDNDNNIDGVDVLTSKQGEITITDVEIKSESASETMGKPIGKYITIETKAMRENDTETQKNITVILSDKLNELLGEKKSESVLVVGLGNWNVTPDALGPKVIDRVFVTRHIMETIPGEIKNSVGSVAAISPGVLGITGIETAEIIKGLVERTKPDVVIAIDALAARSINRINSTIQLSDTGISPGAGIGNGRNPLNMDTLGVPVIAIGVPTVIDAATLLSDTFDKILYSIIEKNVNDKKMVSSIKHICSGYEFEDILNSLEPYSNMFVTPKEVDAVIERLADIIANAINISLHPIIDIDDVKNFSF